MTRLCSAWPAISIRGYFIGKPGASSNAMAVCFITLAHRKAKVGRRSPKALSGACKKPVLRVSYTSRKPLAWWLTNKLLHNLAQKLDLIGNKPLPVVDRLRRERLD